MLTFVEYNIILVFNKSFFLYALKRNILIKRYLQNLIKNTKPYFYIDGSLNSAKFTHFCVLLYAVFIIFSYFNAYFIIYLLCFIAFPVLIYAIQKRCRDLHNHGTYFILIASILFILISATYFIHNEPTFAIIRYIKMITAVLYMSILILCIIPSKPEAGLILRSPLLKYPLLYVVICWILAITATFLVNHYAGITVF